MHILVIEQFTLIIYADITFKYDNSVRAIPQSDEQFYLFKYISSCSNFKILYKKRSVCSCGFYYKTFNSENYDSKSPGVDSDTIKFFGI